MEAGGDLDGAVVEDARAAAVDDGAGEAVAGVAIVADAPEAARRVVASRVRIARFRRALVDVATLRHRVRPFLRRSREVA